MRAACVSLAFAPAANFETLEWLEFHAGKSLQKARVLETELAKFKTTIASVTELAKKRSNGRGTHNLRWIANKVEELKKELQQVRGRVGVYAAMRYRASVRIFSLCRPLPLTRPCSTSPLEQRRQTRLAAKTAGV